MSGQTKSAIALYSEAIEARSLGAEALARALLNRALAYQNSGQYDQAVDDYSAAMRLDALSPKIRAVALYNRGLANQKRARQALAIEDFTNALFLDVEFSQAYYSRGNALRESGQYLFALSDYDTALRFKHPEPHLPMFGKALVYESLRRPENARKTLMRIIADKPDFEPARRKLAELKGVPPGGNGAQALQAETDDITTASTGDIEPDLVILKTDLPEPVRPPAAMTGKPAAKIVARLPQADSIPPQPAGARPQKPATAKRELPSAVPPAIEPAAAAVAASAPQSDNGPRQRGWLVQVSSQRAEDRAWAVWKTLAKRHGKLLDGQEAIVVKADLGADKGIYYRLRINALESADAAKSLCNSLKRRGTSCYVSRAES